MFNIVLDTNSIIGCKFNFKSGSLNRLSLLSSKKILNVYITDITDNEIKSHIKSNARSLAKQLESAINKERLIEQIENKNLIKLFSKLTKSEFGEILSRSFLSAYSEYKKSTQVTILSTKRVPSAKVFDLYFNKRPPFGEGKKKSEFPDAFSVLAVIAYFADDDFFLISGDKDWSNFFTEKNIQYFTSIDLCIDHLTELLERNKQDKKWIKSIFERSKAQIIHDTKDLLENAGYDIDLWDGDINSIEISDITIVDYNIDYYNNNTATYSVNLKATVNATISYDDPDSYYKDDETHEIHYWNRVEDEEITRVLTFNAILTIDIDSQKKTYQYNHGLKISLPSVIYLEFDEYDDFK